MARRSRGGRITRAKARASYTKGGRGRVKKRKTGRRIMRT